LLAASYDAIQLAFLASETKTHLDLLDLGSDMPCDTSEPKKCGYMRVETRPYVLLKLVDGIKEDGLRWGEDWRRRARRQRGGD
jgi:hypothetical protein